MAEPIDLKNGNLVDKALSDELLKKLSSEQDGTIPVQQFQVPLWVTQDWIDDHEYLRQNLHEIMSKGRG